jgi:hypothetical protein
MTDSLQLRLGRAVLAIWTGVACCYRNCLSICMSHTFQSTHKFLNAMGVDLCPAAGVIAMDLARELLGQHPNSIALVVSHENITNNYYSGSDKSMLIPNVRGWFGMLQRLLCLMWGQHVTAC